MPELQAPWSASLGRDEQKRDVEFSDTRLIVPGKLKLWIGGQAPNQRVSIHASLKALRAFGLDYFRGNHGGYNGGAGYVRGPITNSTQANILVSPIPPLNSHVAFCIDGAFIGDVTSQGAGSHFFSETARQLIELYLEQSTAGVFAQPAVLRPPLPFPWQ